MYSFPTITGIIGVIEFKVLKPIAFNPFLTYSAFCLTSLDTATRLARFMFQEFWLEPGQTPKDIKEGWKKVMVNPYFATILTVVLGILLGMTGYAKIWGIWKNIITEAEGEHDE